MAKDRALRPGIGEEGNGAHLATAVGAEQLKGLLDASNQAGPAAAADGPARATSPTGPVSRLSSVNGGSAGPTVHGVTPAVAASALPELHQDGLFDEACWLIAGLALVVGSPAEGLAGRRQRAGVGAAQKEVREPVTAVDGYRRRA